MHPISSISVRLVPKLEARALLDRVLDRAAAMQDRAIVVFDLDSTLLDNRPRQSRIMREYGTDHGVAELQSNQPSHWEGWDPRAPMRNSGLDAAAIETHYEPFRQYWYERFFTSEYCVDDELIPGAQAYAAAVTRTGARLFYVTGRHEPMRAGSIACFQRLGLPVPDGGQVELMMKPSLDESDDDYKARTYSALELAGVVVAAFDNEPAHINGYKQAFPDADSVHLATDHSSRAIDVAPGIPSIRDFTCWASRSL